MKKARILQSSVIHFLCFDIRAMGFTLLDRVIIPLDALSRKKHSSPSRRTASCHREEDSSARLFVRTSSVSLAEAVASRLARARWRSFRTTRCTITRRLTQKTCVPVSDTDVFRAVNFARGKSGTETFRIPGNTRDTYLLVVRFFFFPGKIRGTHLRRNPPLFTETSPKRVKRPSFTPILRTIAQPLKKSQ